MEYVVDTCLEVSKPEVVIHTGVSLSRPEINLSEVTEKTRVIGISIQELRTNVKGYYYEIFFD